MKTRIHQFLLFLPCTFALLWEQKNPPVSIISALDQSASKSNEDYFSAGLGAEAENNLRKISCPDKGDVRLLQIRRKLLIG